jgi:hypothetical protein
MNRTYSYSVVKNPAGAPLKLPPFITQQVVDDIARSFTVRDDDVFIATYPRSGTTWTQQIVHLIANEGRQGDSHLEIIIPYLEKDASFSAMSGRRYFKTHLPYSMNPGLKNSRARCIYVARNPKDCAVSYYYFLSNNSRIAYDGTWEEYLPLFIEGDMLYGGWFDHVLTWWSAAGKSDHILFLKYEDMHRDLYGAIQTIARFIDVPVTAALAEEIVARSSFESMAGNPNTNLAWAAWREDASTKPLRKGRIGDWKRHFTASQNEMFDRIYKERMAGSGLDFDFE